MIPHGELILFFEWLHQCTQATPMPLLCFLITPVYSLYLAQTGMQMEFWPILLYGI